MKKPILVALSLSVLALPASVAGQDYTQYQVQRISQLPGSTVDLGMAMVEHNELYHAEAPYAANVFYMVTGEFAGQFQWAMGPTTFADIDVRPGDPGHDADWANRVIRNAQVLSNDFWIQVDDLSYQVESGEARPVSLVRRFDVADAQLFRKVQRQIMETFAAAGAPNPRIMYQRRGLSKDPWGWALVISYPSWAAMDEPFDFAGEFRARNGDAAWETFLDEFGRAVNGRDDSIRVLLSSN